MEANLSCRCGAKANFIGNDVYTSAEVKNWRADHLNCSKLLTTVEPTQTVPTMDHPSAAEESGMRAYLMDKQPGGVNLFTTPTTQPSSQSDPVDTRNGPAARSSGFAHCGRPLIAEMGWEYEEPHLLVVTCQICNASWRLGRIPVQDVVATSSTSLKQPSSESVESSVEESVKSRLKELINSISVLKDFEAKTDKDKGYQEGITTAQAWMEMKLRSIK